MGLALFLIGAQLPYEHTCIRDFPCITRTLIDVTADRRASQDAWHVSMWLTLLAPVLLAAALIHRRAANGRRAAGFVAFSGINLVALYLPNAAPLMFFGRWEPGAALWPVGAILMTISASLSIRRVVPDLERDPAPSKSWLVLIVGGIALSAIAVWIGSNQSAYVLSAGMIIIAAGLLLMRGRTRDKALHARWAVVPLLLGAVSVGASYFASWSRGEFAYLLIRTEFMFDLKRTDFWQGIVLLSLIAGAMAASIHLLGKGVPNAFLVGGALAGPYLLLVSLSTGFGYEGFTQTPPAVQLSLIGVAFLLVGIVYLALRDARRSHVTVRLERT